MTRMRKIHEAIAMNLTHGFAVIVYITDNENDQRILI
jgi:secreted PhoX family phosphatase